MILEIDGYEITNIVDYDDLPSTQDGENSGRNPNLTMNREILGRVLSINVKLVITHKSVAEIILKKLKNPSMVVRFHNSETNKLDTCNSMYCIDPKKNRLEGMFDYYESIEFTLNSNERWD